MLATFNKAGTFVSVVSVIIPFSFQHEKILVFAPLVCQRAISIRMCSFSRCIFNKNCTKSAAFFTLAQRKREYLKRKREILWGRRQCAIIILLRRREALFLYRIAICDDEPLFAESLHSQVDDVLFRYEIQYCVTVFSDPRELLSELLRNPDAFHLVLLDIMMENMNGIDLARALRESKSRAGIIFITANSSFALEGYAVRPIQYLLKPADPVKLREAILCNPVSLIRQAQVGPDCKKFVVYLNQQYAVIFFADFPHNRKAVAMSGGVSF
jgi:CheY-like chemotaxis protein